MSKHKEITIRIEKPCHADWNSMAETPEGKHCGHCAKNVFDATELNPEEIFALLKEKKGNVCMRMRSEVVDVPFSIPAKPWYDCLYQNYKKVAIFLGFQFVLLNQIKAQLSTLIIGDKNADGILKKYLKSGIIKGKVTEISGKFPIEGAQVVLLRDNKVLADCFTNELGEYVLTLKDSIEDNGTVKIRFSAMGYQNVEINDFVLNKNEITLGKVELPFKIFDIKPVEVRYTKKHWVTMGAPVYVHTRGSIPKSVNIFPSGNEVDPSPRQPRIDIEGGGRDLIR